jgi:hypothetical protein
MSKIGPDRLTCLEYHSNMLFNKEPAGYVAGTPAGSVTPAGCVAQPAGSVIVLSPNSTPKVPTGGNLGNFLTLADFNGITNEDPFVPELGPWEVTSLETLFEDVDFEDVDLEDVDLEGAGLVKAFTLLAWVTTELATTLGLGAVGTDGKVSNSENNPAPEAELFEVILLLRRRDLYVLAALNFCHCRGVQLKQTAHLTPEYSKSIS